MNIVYRGLGVILLVALALNLFFGTSIYEGDAALFQLVPLLDEFLLLLVAGALCTGILPKRRPLLDAALAVAVLPLLLVFYQGVVWVYHLASAGSILMATTGLGQAFAGALVFVYLFQVYRKYRPEATQGANEAE